MLIVKYTLEQPVFTCDAFEYPCTVPILKTVEDSGVQAVTVPHRESICRICKLNEWSLLYKKKLIGTLNAN